MEASRAKSRRLFLRPGLRLIFAAGLISAIILAAIWGYRHQDTAIGIAQKVVQRLRADIDGPLRFESTTPWKKTAPGMTLRTVRVTRGKERIALPLVGLRMDQDRFFFRVVTVPFDKFPTTSIREVCGDSGAWAVINGSYFNKENKILGLALSDGKEVSAQTLRGENRGIFFVRDNRALLIHRDEYKSENVLQALQAGPWLVQESSPQTKFKHPSQISRRSAVCLDQEDNVLFIVTNTSLNGITLPDFARVLADTEMGFGCKKALNLDGGTSSQMISWAPKHRMMVRGFVNVPAYIAAIPRKKEP